MDLKRRMPLLRWSVWRMATGVRNITTTGQIGDGREAAAVDYVLQNARAGDIDDVLATIDKFAYEKSMLINVGDEKGLILDAAVRRADPALALELGTYCGYGALRIARAAPNAKVYSVELAEANAANARRIWAHAGVADRVTCVVGTIGDGGRTLDALANEHGFTSGALDFVFLDHDKDAYLDDLTEHPRPGLAAPGHRSWSPTTSGCRARRSTASTCASSRASCGTPSSTRRTSNTSPWCPTWCWSPITSAEATRGHVEIDVVVLVACRHNNVDLAAEVVSRAELLRPGVGSGPHFAQRVHGHQRVDLRRRHRGMPQ